MADLVDRLARIVHGIQFTSGLNPAHWEALRFVARANRNSRNPKALAKFLGVTKGTISQTVSALEAKGYVRRSRSFADRRSVLIELSEDGRKLIEQDPLCLVRQAITNLLDQECDELTAGMERLIGSLQRAKGLPSFGPCHDCAYHCAEAGGNGTEASSRCALSGEMIPPDEVDRICMDFESRGSAVN